MTAERYNILSKGELLQGFTLAQVIPRLIELFGSDEKSISRIFSTKPQIIIRNLTWHQAVKYQQKLKKAGLVIYLDLAPNPELFRASLMPAKDHFTTTPPLPLMQPEMAIAAQTPANISEPDEEPCTNEQEFQFVIFNSEELNPLLFASAHEETLVDEQEKPLFELKNFNHVINYKLMLGVSLFCALLIQKYFTMLLLPTGNNGFITFVSIIIFLLIILFLPVFMRPRRIFTLTKSETGSAYLLCSQKANINPFISYYEIYSSQDELLAIIKYNRLKTLLQCMNKRGNILFTSSAEHNIDDVTRSATEDLRDELFNLSFLKYLEIIRRWQKRLKNRTEQTPAYFESENARVVRDRNEKKIAFYYPESISAIEYPAVDENDKQQKILIAFLLVCAGLN